MKANIRFWATMTLLLQLAGCGGSGDEATSSSSGAGSTTGASVPTITLSLTDPVTKGPITSISMNQIAQLTTTVTDPGGAPVANSKVTITAGNTLVSVVGALTGNPYANETTVTTDSNGQALTTLSATSTKSGTSSVTAKATTSAGTGTKSLTFSIDPVNYLLTLAMTDPATGKDIRTISSVAPAKITAKLTSPTGAAVANTLLAFSSGDSFLNNVNAALTDKDGIATVTMTTSSTYGGASTLKATTTIDGTEVTGTLAYSIATAKFSLNNLTLPTTPISAYGTAQVVVDVLVNGVKYSTPTIVNFSSACAASGKASITQSVTSINGQATAKFLDNGCNNSSPGDVITASLSSDTMVTATGNLPVSSPELGSLRFVSVFTNPSMTPPMITLKGTGGQGLSETAKVTFKVVDKLGNPLGNKPVSFALNTALGGLSLTTDSTTSDPLTGEASTTVVAGTISTVVRVTASAGGLSSQSDLLVVSTGIPAQDSFSFAASQRNIEGWDYDGEQVTLTTRLADHFHNPVPDGTAVYFTTEGGSVQPQCVTKDGACSVKFTSQNLRPTNGRVTVLATAIGEEAFIDKNLNGMVDSEDEMVDANASSSDTGEAYLDYNENGLYDAASEPSFVDFNGNGKFDGTSYGLGVGTSSGDRQYNGVLCKPGSLKPDGTQLCSAQKSINVRGSQIIVFSTSGANITINSGGAISLQKCDVVAGKNGDPIVVPIVVTDSHGNAMPKDTKIAFTTTNGKLINATVETVADTAACIGLKPNCPDWARNAAHMSYAVSAQTDATFTAAVKDAAGTITTPATCKNDITSGSFTVTVTTPKGNVTKASIAITD